ncbi:class II aldolase/adducin family protein [Deltaproteobacteria bacterium]|nr:class II aldolase/adducin family protein [Deltaproteobacteria bacterium]
MMDSRTMNSELELKKLILDIGNRLWTRGYIAANDGNISVRMSDSEILTTPTGVSKGFMSQEMIIKINMEGEVISPNNRYRPSSEVKMHIEIYKQREDVGAVVHAHPPYSTSFAVAGIPFDSFALPEAIMTLGAVPIAPYGTPSTSEIPDSIIPLIQNSDAVLLANHGALTLGIDLITAYHRMETLEHTANIIFLAMGLGNVNRIPEEQIDKLMEIRDQMNIPGKVDASSASGYCLEESFGMQAKGNSMTEGLIETITKRVLKRLKQTE